MKWPSKQHADLLSLRGNALAHFKIILVNVFLVGKQAAFGPLVAAAAAVAGSVSVGAIKSGGCGASLDGEDEIAIGSKR